MKKKHFDVGTYGFYGAYWKCKSDSDCAMIAMIGDDSEDYLARTSVKWLHKLGVNVMTMSPGKKDYGHHNKFIALTAGSQSNDIALSTVCRRQSDNAVDLAAVSKVNGSGPSLLHRYTICSFF